MSDNYSPPEVGPEVKWNMENLARQVKDLGEDQVFLILKAMFNETYLSSMIRAAKEYARESNDPLLPMSPETDPLLTHLKNK